MDSDGDGDADLGPALRLVGIVGFLVSADTAADLKVTMTWRKADDTTGPDPT